MRTPPPELMVREAEKAGYTTKVTESTDGTNTVTRVFIFTPQGVGQAVATYENDKFYSAWIWAAPDIPLQRISSTLLKKFLRGEYFPHIPSVVPVALRPYVVAIAEEKIK